MAKFINLQGQRFGRLVVLQRGKTLIDKSGKKINMWDCLCDCGKKITIRGFNLRNGHTKSCGCLQKDVVRKIRSKHYLTKRRDLYFKLNNIKQRCYCKNNNRYKNYGGRGIAVCEEWLGKHGNENFQKWAIENGYRKGLTIDRIDVNGNYEPSNCRWIVAKEQARNKTSNVFITYNGLKKTIAEWSVFLGVKSGFLYYRKKVGWNDKDIIEKPLKKRI